uniref:Large ribosomal subunit protein bL21c n=1 Tax=Gracilariopsis longissima TaxID=172976 RepID=A0A345U9A8_9FLOR|nr:ribosomal protein L21 [Gracilariopsis longissima]AXI97044.1 ribosomal protein L21 [Gracilariopsis longissima]UAD88960.1 ribosomal protein L21 [Gracilariopsis longissima]
MTYAIIEADGKQLWVQPGKYYDLNYIPGQPGDNIQLNRILIVKQQDNIYLGNPCIGSITIKAKILKHLTGRKINVFKTKAKKNYRKKNGHKQKLTRLLIEEILN